MANLLIKRGADVNAEDDSGLTPLEWSIEEDHGQFADVLIKNGANKDHVKGEGEPVVMFAAFHGKYSSLPAGNEKT